MTQYPVLPTGTRPQPINPTSTLLPAAPRTLDPPHRVLFAQRLAVLIKRIRTATKEGNTHEQ
jgi:hypothetical protein